MQTSKHIAQRIVDVQTDKQLNIKYTSASAPLDAIEETSMPSTAQHIIRELLKLRRFNLTRIALEIGISKASASRILSGAIRQTNGKTFSKLLALYCSIFYGKK
jgi:hypothetical protein